MQQTWPMGTLSNIGTDVASQQRLAGQVVVGLCPGSEGTCSVHDGDSQATVLQSGQHRNQEGGRQHLIHHRPPHEQRLRVALMPL